MNMPITIQTANRTQVGAGSFIIKYALIAIESKGVRGTRGTRKESVPEDAWGCRARHVRPENTMIMTSRRKNMAKQFLSDR